MTLPCPAGWVETKPPQYLQALKGAVDTDNQIMFYGIVPMAAVVVAGFWMALH